MTIERRFEESFNRILSDCTEEIYTKYYFSKTDMIYSKERLKTNVIFLDKLLTNYKDILIVGGKTFIDFVLEDLGLYKNKNITYTDFDLRYKFPYVDSSFDFIINSEVIEHIKDQDGSLQVDVFNFSGLDNFMKELNRVLKKDGKMFMTTPNSCSFKNLIKLLQHRNHMRYFYHVREYSFDDLKYMADKYGFIIESLQDIDVGIDIEEDLNCINLSNHIRNYENLFRGYSKEMRGDTFYILLLKDDKSEN